jgi:hypothetical protein
MVHLVAHIVVGVVTLHFLKFNRLNHTIYYCNRCKLLMLLYAIFKFMELCGLREHPHIDRKFEGEVSAVWGTDILHTSIK